MNQEKIIIKGARENNLKNIDIELPRNQFIVMTGVSGSGKTSLAFDTIYAEGQRRYVESLSAYARQFLGNSEKPDVDLIEGLSPAIAIDQKTTSNNPRSTVGTVTEIYDYLRLMYGRIGVPYCPTHHQVITGQTIKVMVERVMNLTDQERLMILSPVIKNQKGTFKDYFEKLKKTGFTRVLVDNQTFALEDEIVLEKNKKHNISIIIDRLIKKDDQTFKSRLHDSLEVALKQSDGLAVVQANSEQLLFSSNYSCPICGFSVPNIEPRLFSFNNPLGACGACNGLGVVQQVDVDYLIPDQKKSLRQGAISYYKNIVDSENIEWQMFNHLCATYDVDLDVPFKSLSDHQKKMILVGSDKTINYVLQSRSGNVHKRNDFIEGVVTLIERRYRETTSSMAREWYQSFLADSICPVCLGKRLNTTALAVYVGDKNIAEFAAMNIEEAYGWMMDLKLSNTQREIANLVSKEIKERLSFLTNVGLEYLTLNRMAGSLSGGEAQRIRLATQIGSRLTGVLYVLDEPSIGLHQRDNAKLIQTLKDMRDLGNSLIVVEHDEETMMACDWLVDIGPMAGEEGGRVIVNAPLAEGLLVEDSITAQYLTGRKTIDMPKEYRPFGEQQLKIIGASGNNLKDITVTIPLHNFVCITGVSGSGKSTLINEILAKAIFHNLGRIRMKPLAHQAIEGMDNIDKLVVIDQDPIGRTPRSNPATYTGVFDEIRDLFASTPAAKLRGYDKGRFSFNVKGGRCDACQGDGVKRISMNFLPDVYVKCEECHGKRYNEETLQVTYKEKSIFDILDMSVDEGVKFFAPLHRIAYKLQIMQDVGLGYIKLGQNAVTLSGGEAQRVKLAFELQKKATGKTLYILDEPTTGLHKDDVKKLLEVLQRIVNLGDSILIIEHNLDIIKSADYIVDLGPEGGDKGGQVIAIGSIFDIIKSKRSYTAKYLKALIEKE